MDKLISRLRQYLGVIAKHLHYCFSSLSKYKILLQNPLFVRLASADIISFIGSKISYFALLRKVYEISAGNVADLGFVAILAAIPHIFLGPVAGALSDRVSRRWVMITADITNGVLILSLIFINSLTAIKFIAFLASCCYVFSGPAQKALEPNLVVKNDLPLLNSFKSFSCSFVIIVGSALGGAIVGFAGVNVSFSIDAATFFISAVLVFSMRITEQHQDRGNGGSDTTGVRKALITFKNDIKSGITIIRKDNCIKFLFFLEMAVAFLFSLEGTLFYPFVREALKMGNKSDFAFGGLLTADSIGLMIGSLFFGVVIASHSNKIKLFLDIIIFDGILFLLFSLNNYYCISLVLCFVIGLVCAPTNIIIDTLIQETVEDKNRGKIFSFINILSTPMTMLSIFVGTSLAKLITAQGVFVLFALLRILMACSIRLSKSYQNIFRPIQESSPERLNLARSLD